MKFGDNFRKECLDEGSMPSTSTQKNQLGFRVKRDTRNESRDSTTLINAARAC